MRHPSANELAEMDDGQYDTYLDCCDAERQQQRDEAAERAEEQAERTIIAQYIADGEPGGCYWCGKRHSTNSCKNRVLPVC